MTAQEPGRTPRETPREDPRLRAARYLNGPERTTAGSDAVPDPGAGADSTPESDMDLSAAEDGAAASTGSSTPSGTQADEEHQRQRRIAAQSVEAIARTAVDRAIADGAFDHLAYAGKPLPASVSSTDPDWWTKSLLQREDIHAAEGTGPEALLLRVADARLDAELDSLHSERAVIETIEAFNHRIIEARRQLLGGPPVITPLRDPATEVARWRERAAQRRAAQRRGAQRGADQHNPDQPSPEQERDPQTQRRPRRPWGRRGRR